ncbi:MAG: hypothetical protein H0U12_08160 [Thermoleophilaceae bacterium]|jgi:hypothetical protein|nr:hypothetical protein [Thermoleophilaceae bacterium]
MWFGLLGAPLAWTVQHVVGITLIEAACNQAGSQWGVPVDGWTVAATAVAVIVAALSGAAAFMAYRATKDAGTDLPEARVRFLAIVGIVVSPLFLSIVLMSGITVVAFPECVQS